MADILTPRAEEGGYVVDLDGYMVIYCHVDMRFGIQLSRPPHTILIQESVDVKFEGEFDISIDGATFHLDPERDRTGLGPALNLLWRTVESCRIKADGMLEITFGDQTTIRAPSDRKYEAWQISKNDGQLVICIPGGEIGWWGPNSETPRERDAVKKDIINPPSLAKPVGFNHGIVTSGGRLLFLAGQDASDAAGHIVAPGDVVGQLHQVLLNLRAVVEAAGGTMQDIVKLNIYVRDRDGYVAHRKALGRVFRNQFGHYYPTMALFEVSRLFQDDALIELEGIAVLT
jgi:enamine deaminase RidA (YjgF/YER057c/UK114 family)